MNLPVGLTVTLLLVFQSLQEVSLQDSNKVPSDQPNGSTDDSTNVASAGIPFVSMASGEEEPQATNSTSDDMTLGVMTTEGLPTDAPEASGSSEGADAETLPPSIPLNSSSDLPDLPLNATAALPEAPTHPSTPSPKGWPSLTNGTRPSPETNSTVETGLVDPDSESWLTNSTETNGTEDSLNATATDATESQPPPTEPPSELPSDSPSGTTPDTPSDTAPADLPGEDTTTVPTTITVGPNITAVGSDVKGNVERGLASGVKNKQRGEAWGAILGTGLAVGFVGLVIYAILKHSGRRDFSHRKLIEDMPPDPILRLDNSEPLDLKYDGSAYYNPGLQGDNIQMTNFPQGRAN